MGPAAERHWDTAKEARRRDDRSVRRAAGRRPAGRAAPSIARRRRSLERLSLPGRASHVPQGGRSGCGHLIIDGKYGSRRQVRLQEPSDEVLATLRVGLCQDYPEGFQNTGLECRAQGILAACHLSADRGGRHILGEMSAARVS